MDILPYFHKNNRHACILTDWYHILRRNLKIILKLAQGFNILQNNGETAGQSVFHFHMHLIPRYKGDGQRIKIGWIPGMVLLPVFISTSTLVTFP